MSVPIPAIYNSFPFYKASVLEREATTFHSNEMPRCEMWETIMTASIFGSSISGSMINMISMIEECVYVGVA